MNSSISLTQMKCNIEGHSNSNYVGLCIDSNCNEEIKLICIECIFQNHQQHKMIKLKEFENKINDEINKVIFQNKAQEQLEKMVKNEEKKLLDFFAIIKDELNIILHKKRKAINSDFKKMIKKFNIEKNRISLSFFTNSSIYPPNNESDLLELSNFLQKYYKDKTNLHSKLELSRISNKEEAEKVKKELIQFDKNFKIFCNEQLILLSKFFQNKFLLKQQKINIPIKPFEWNNKVFGSYGFLYEISDGGKKVTKTISDGTITIVIGKDKLDLGNDYYIEFEINCPKSGDFDVGFGKESVGYSCWIRTVAGYGMTNVGLYENGKLTKKDLKLSDKDIIGFEIYLKEQKRCKVKVKNNIVAEFPIEIDEIFPMCGIRKIGNSVYVKQFYLLD